MGLNLESTISLNSASFERGMGRVKESVTDGLKNFALGAIGVTTIEQALSKTIDTADELVNTSKRLNIPIEQLQILRQAAKDAGSSTEALTSAMEKLNQARAMALGGGLTGDKSEQQEYLKMFQRLGVSKSQLSTSSSGDILMGAIADKVKSVNPQTIVEPLREVLGRGAGEIIPALQVDFQELGDKMKRIGAIMDSTTAVELKTFKDEMGLLSQVLMSQFAPAIIFLGKIIFQVNAVLGTFGTWLGSIMQEFAFFVEKGSIPKDTSTPTQDAYDYFRGQQEVWKGIEDHAKSIADGLKNPKPSTFEFHAEAAEKKRRPVKFETDSLVKVGNFLGSSRGAINSSQARMEKHAAGTENNTKVIADAMRWLVNNSKIKGASGSPIETILWPVN